METKLSGLTGFNVKAIQQLIPEDLGVTTTATTATFAMDAETALHLVKTKKAQTSGPANAHPRSSLNAVIRKLEKERQKQNTAKVNAEIDAAVGIDRAPEQKVALRDMDADQLEARLERIKQQNPHTFEHLQSYRNTAARLRRLRAPFVNSVTGEPLPAIDPLEVAVAAEQEQHEAAADLEFEALEYDPICDHLLDMRFENMFEKASARPNEPKLRCKGCGAIVSPTARESHFKAHRAFRAHTKETKMATTATRRQSNKAKKVTAQEQGFPGVYLAPNGNFKPGYDAAAKGDLVCAFLGIEKKDARHSFTKAEAKTLLEARGWMGYVATKQAAIANAADRKAKAQTARAANAKKTATAKSSGATSGRAQAKPDPKKASTRRKTKTSSSRKIGSRSLRSVK